ncbi:putative baseplate assembly protein [Paenibacillus sp. HJGM_3]|uniref:putative baseplate assembly protein n=1 Tax=Paenibacillus sp. HJGM_3 TaxID=3379816 RepID=UPI00385C183F
MLPLPKLDDKTFGQLAEDAKKWIPRYAPEWTDHNVHDPGITFVEMFAWLTELQIYYLDQVREENERKYLKLLGVTSQDAKPARTDVTFSLTGADGDYVTVPEGTALAAGDVRLETDEPLTVTSVGLHKIVSFHSSGVTDHTDANLRVGLTFSPFGPNAEPGSKLYLGFDRPFPEKERIPITFRFYEAYEVPAGIGLPDVTPSALVAWEYYSAKDGGSWWPLEVEQDGTLMLSRSGRLTFLAPDDPNMHVVYPFNDSLYWIRATVRQGSYELPPKLEGILLHTVSAVQTVTSSESIGQSIGLPGQTFALSRFPVISGSLQLQVEEMTDGVLSWTEWRQVDGFEASGPTDRHYVLKAETGQILFGDGLNGAIPPASLRSDPDSSNIRAFRYQSTLGERGNVGAFTVGEIAEPNGSLHKLTVENRLPAAGGVSRETLEDAKTRARREILACTRAVTSDDFETLALSTPGLRVSRAKALPLLGEDGTSTKGVVTIVVVPFSEYPNPLPSEGFLATVWRHLNRHRLITTRVRVVPPEYVKITIEGVIQLKPGFNPSGTRDKVEAALLKFLHPLEGGPEGTGWPFGRPVYLSEIYEAIELIPGAECAQDVRITAAGQGVKRDDSGNVVISPLSLVYSEGHQIEIAAAEASCGMNGGCHGSERTR